jgi:hypothetical protein
MKVKMKLYENEARTRGPIKEISTSNTYYTNDTKTMIALQELRDVALEKATKYRWDPWLSDAHEEYLKKLNDILKDVG